METTEKIGKPLYQELASLLRAISNCRKSRNEEWEKKHQQKLWDLVKNCMPSGSGIDNGVAMDVEKSSENRLVFYSEFHLMDGNGFYSGWRDFKIVITPSLYLKFDCKVTGKLPDDLKEDLHERFSYALEQLVQ